MLRQRVRTLGRGWVAFLCICSLVFWSAASAQPASARGADRITCTRHPSVPKGIDVWAVIEGKIFYDKPFLFHKNLRTDAVIYRYEPSSPNCRKTQSAKPKASVTTSAARASDEAARKKKADDLKKKKREAEESAKKAADALEQAEKELADKKAREAQEAKQRLAAPAQAAAPRHQPRAQQAPGVLPNQKDAAQLPNQKDAAQLPTVTKGPVPQPMTALCQGCAPKHVQCPVIAAPKSPLVSLGRDKKDDPATMSVRKPIREAIVAYEKAQGKGEAQREAHRRKLRELFESIPRGAALRFHVMLAGNNELAKKSRAVLNCDPLHNELLAILKAKYSPAPQRTLGVASVAPKAAAMVGGVRLVSSLSAERAFDELHQLARQGIEELRAGALLLRDDSTTNRKNNFLKEYVPRLQAMLDRAEQARKTAFEQQSDATTKAEAIKNAGTKYTAVLVAIWLFVPKLNLTLVGDWALSAKKKPDIHMLPVPIIQYETEMASLLKAAFSADAAKMNALMPAAQKRYPYWVAERERLIELLQDGAVLTTRVEAVANLALIAVSFYQVYRAPAAFGGGSSTPLITGLLPGGVALGSRVSVASLQGAAAGIRHLIAIGALDGTLIGGLGTIAIAAGGPPTLQPPTSLSVQGPNQPGGSGTGSGSGSSTTQTSQSAGTPAARGADWKSVKFFQHTFKKHGQGAKITRSLIDTARATGKPQGQWLNNQAAADLLQSHRAGLNGSASIRIPKGLGQVIMPDGSIVNATGATLIPGPNGFITAYPIP